MQQMKEKKPLPVWIRYVMGPVWSWLVYHSNRRFHGRETWYDIKDRVRPSHCEVCKVTGEKMGYLKSR